MSTANPVAPCDFVVFGGTGDLAVRKLLPALYLRDRDGQLPGSTRIIAASRAGLDVSGYRDKVRGELGRFVAKEALDDQTLDRFLARLHYASIDFTDASDWYPLTTVLQADPGKVRVFYLACAPTLFGPISAHLATHNLVDESSRVVLEKPIGHDLASACAINDAVGSVFEESQIFRIDHYLGKESVQNLLALRFGNAMFEPLWSRAWVRDVQITIAETVGAEGRGEFYDTTGALRDMIQSHLLQLLCIVAMEPPASIDPDAVRDAKLQVLRALKRFTATEVATRTVRGQYKAGAVDGQPVPGYLEEPGIKPGSRTETFVAIKAELGNWRWAGVPFYLRTGKRMQERRAEIVINFHNVPHAILDVSGSARTNNRLIIRLQPEDGLSLDIQAKMPGEGMRVQSVSLDLQFEDELKARRLDAYERLLMDVIRGRLTLFMRRDELEAAWSWVEPIMHAWAAADDPPKTYTAGTWGPAASSALIGRDNLAWLEEA